MAISAVKNKTRKTVFSVKRNTIMLLDYYLFAESSSFFVHLFLAFMENLFMVHPISFETFQI